MSNETDRRVIERVRVASEEMGAAFVAAFRHFEATGNVKARHAVAAQLLHSAANYWGTGIEKSEDADRIADLAKESLRMLLQTLLSMLANRTKDIGAELRREANIE
jgi:hypothetical protein